MRFTLKTCAESAKSRSFYPNSVRRLPTAYHLQLNDPISWTYARDVQNAIVKAYQEYHVNPFRPGYALRPTFITLRFKPVFTYGRCRDERPSVADRKLLEGLPDEDGYVMETRMAWNRQNGWRFHGPGQLWCWMVCDMRDWNVDSFFLRGNN
jgi:lipoate-protein ligase B